MAPRGAQEGPKTGPRAPQERPKRAPRGSFEGPDGGLPWKLPTLLIDGLQDGPRRASKAAKRAPREPQERPKRAPREHQEGPMGFPHVPKKALRWPQKAYKIAQDSSQHASKRLQDRPKTALSGQGASQGGPREAKIFQPPNENQCFWPSRLFASDGLLRPQDGSKMGQEGPKRGPRGPQDGPKSAQERPKSAPRGPQEAHLKAATGGGKNSPPIF